MRMCNKCGADRVPEGRVKANVTGVYAIAIDIGRGDAYGFVATFGSGYYSYDPPKGLPDGHQYSFAICEPCAVEFMNTFKIPAMVKEI